MRNGQIIDLYYLVFLAKCQRVLVNDIMQYYGTKKAGIGQDSSPDLLYPRGTGTHKAEGEARTEDD